MKNSAAIKIKGINDHVRSVNFSTEIIKQTRHQYYDLCISPFSKSIMAFYVYSSWQSIALLNNC